jgi:hypothetical protein
MDHYAILQRSSPGEMLIRQGSEPENLFYLLRGRCSVNCVLPNGKNIILSSISHPCLIGEMELIDPKRSALSVKTLEYCELLTFPMSVSRSVLLNNVSFLHAKVLQINNKYLSHCVICFLFCIRKQPKQKKHRPQLSYYESRAALPIGLFRTDKDYYSSSSHTLPQPRERISSELVISS